MMDLKQHSWRLLANHCLNCGAGSRRSSHFCSDLTGIDPAWQHCEPGVDAFQMTSSDKRTENIQYGVGGEETEACG